MDKENNNDSSVRVQFLDDLSALILVVNVFVIINFIMWTMPTRNEEQNNSQRSISSIYSSFVNQPERKVKE